jgi:hypothetical protein
MQASPTVISIRIASVSIVPFTSASISVALYQTDVSNSTFVGSTSVIMPTVDYLKWNSDDQYLINYVFTKLNYTLLN